DGRCDRRRCPIHRRGADLGRRRFARARRSGGSPGGYLVVSTVIVFWMWPADGSADAVTVPCLPTPESAACGPIWTETETRPCASVEATWTFAARRASPMVKVTAWFAIGLPFGSSNTLVKVSVPPRFELN